MPRPKRRPRRVAPRALVVGGLLSLVAVGLIVVNSGRLRTELPATPGMSLSPEAAFDSATSLRDLGQFRASLPYYRHALRARPQSGWSEHLAFATALSNATLQFTTRGGVRVPETRSSGERVVLLREAIEQYERAALLAPHDTTRARIVGIYANLLYVYGFTWDAFVAYRKASQADPTVAAYAQQGDALMDMLHDPAGATIAPAPTGRAKGGGR
jgi:tetratricopeptide (TPR) repeat protein